MGPLPPTILPGVGTSTKTKYKLRWKVYSAFPVREHNIYYMRIIHGQNHFHQSGVRCYGQNDCTDCKMQDSCNMINMREQQPQGSRRSMKDLQDLLESQTEATQLLMELVPYSRYRVKIQTVNEFGRSHWSKDFEFDTYGAESQRPSLFSASSSASSLKAVSLLLVVSFINIGVQLSFLL